MALRIAQMQSAPAAVDVDGVLDRAVAELGTAIAELRQIAHGLRPTSLDDGLHAALRRADPVAADPGAAATSTPATLPDDLATTAYYVACEAVTNAAKHAGAERVAVRVDRDDADRCGSGWRTTAAGAPRYGRVPAWPASVDRVAALGGSMTMRSPSGGGTVIEAVLPCAS